MAYLQIGFDTIEFHQRFTKYLNFLNEDYKNAIKHDIKNAIHKYSKKYCKQTINLL